MVSRTVFRWEDRCARTVIVGMWPMLCAVMWRCCSLSNHSRAMRQRILGSHTPPCHRRMVITTQFNVSPRRTAALLGSVPLQVVYDCALAAYTSGSARTHHAPTAPVSL